MITFSNIINNKINISIISLFFLGLAYAQDPNWEDNFVGNDYEFTATLSSAVVRIDGIDQTTGKLAAFVGDEIRGVDSDGASPLPPIPGAYVGSIYEVSLYSNSTGGEEFTFKFYDDVNDVVIDLDESIIFGVNDIIGNINEPFILNGTAPDAVSGCTDNTACNFDQSANEDDGSCIFPEENFDCDSNCLVDVDCNGDCGGDAVVVKIPLTNR